MEGVMHLVTRAGRIHVHSILPAAGKLPIRLSVALLVVSRAQRPMSVVRTQRAAASSSPGSSSRSSSTVTARPKPGLVYPERLLIYHGGTGRTTFLACAKISSIFVFIFFCFVAAPPLLATTDVPLWKPCSLIVCGLVPLAVAIFFTSPFVAFVHIRLPPFARQSRDLLERFASKLPSDTRVDITTINLIGKPRVTHMVVSDIAPVRARFGIVNYALTQGSSRSTPKSPPLFFLQRLYKARTPREFSIQQSASGAREGWVWERVASAISRAAGNG